MFFFFFFPILFCCYVGFKKGPLIISFSQPMAAVCNSYKYIVVVNKNYVVNHFVQGILN